MLTPLLPLCLLNTENNWEGVVLSKRGGGWDNPSWQGHEEEEKERKKKNGDGWRNRRGRIWWDMKKESRRQCQRAGEKLGDEGWRLVRSGDRFYVRGPNSVTSRKWTRKRQRGKERARGGRHLWKVITWWAENISECVCVPSIFGNYNLNSI